MLSALFTILMFVVLLSVVVFFHEMGHFLVGKFFKIGVEAFAIGFGKAIFKFKKGETEYRLNWIPFGGYCKFVGEIDDDDVSEEEKEKAFTLRPAYQRSAVIFAGPFMNVVLAFLIFSIMFLVGFPTPTTLIGSVNPDSPAAKAGIVPGDRIVGIEGKEIWRWEDMSEMLSTRPEMSTKIVIERDSQRIETTITPEKAAVRNIFQLYDTKGKVTLANQGDIPVFWKLNSAAKKSGFSMSNKLLSIDGSNVTSWNEVAENLKGKEKSPVWAQFECPDGPNSFLVLPKISDDELILKLIVPKGVIGVAQNGLRPIVGVPNPDSVAGQSGLKTGVQVIEVDGIRIFYQETLARLLSDGKAHTLVVAENWDKLEKDWITNEIQLAASELPDMASYGIEFTDMYIYEIIGESSPAEMAGLKAHDKLVSVEGYTISGWEEFTKIVHDNPEKEISLGIIRDGQTLDVRVTPELVEGKDLMGEEYRFGKIGIMRMAAYEPTELRPEKYLNPITILKRGMELSIYWTVITLKAFVFIFSGDVSPKAIGGPITIAVMAGESARLGIFPFFLLMAIISLNLAVVNLLPIPVFDGGHLALNAIEMIRRRPIEQRIKEMIMRVGLAMLGIMIVLILYNDIARFSFNIKEMFQKVINF